MSHVPAKYAMSVNHRRTRAAIVAHAKRDVGCVYDALDFLHLFERCSEGLLHVHRLAGLGCQCDYRQAKLLGRGEADDVYFGIFDGAFKVLAGPYRSINVPAFSQHLLVEINASMELHSWGLDDVR
jgi:hypothetical protein